MMLSFNTFVGLVIFWLALCCLCGVKRRFALFGAVLCLGLGLNALLLSGVWQISLTDTRALMAQGSGIICALTAFLMGRFVGHIQAAWIESRVDSSGV